jgi:hypothetical protein
MYKASYFSLWLIESSLKVSDQYTFRLLKSSSTLPKEAIAEIKAIVTEAHEDAKRRLRNLAGISLDPLGSPSAFDPSQGYPECLDNQTLKGYFGEILAGIVAVNCSRFGENDWEMPVSLFRFHDLAFDQIERLRQDAGAPKKIPGRTGDDNLAFVRNANKAIAKVLVCEAKCTADHDSGLISDAHKKISERNLVPVSLRNLIDTLQDYDDVQSREWIDAIRQFWLLPKASSTERYDLVSYACGREPARASQISWIASDKPHSAYSGGRCLEVAEIHLHQVDELIAELYGKHETHNEPA